MTELVIWNKIQWAIIECRHLQGDWMTVIMLATLESTRTELAAETAALKRAAEYTEANMNGEHGCPPEINDCPAIKKECLDCVACWLRYFRKVKHD